MTLLQKLIVWVGGCACVIACLWVPYKLNDTVRFHVMPGGGGFYAGHPAITRYQLALDVPPDDDENGGLHYQAIGLTMLGIVVLAFTAYSCAGPGYDDNRPVEQRPVAVPYNKPPITKTQPVAPPVVVTKTSDQISWEHLSPAGNSVRSNR